jgi:hypothetical protein
LGTAEKASAPKSAFIITPRGAAVGVQSSEWLQQSSLHRCARDPRHQTGRYSKIPAPYSLLRLKWFGVKCLKVSVVMDLMIIIM